MEPLELLIIAVVAVAALAIILSRRSSYKSHVQQLAPAKPKRQLVVGTWSREEVAKHATADDLWLIIKDQASGVAKVYDVTDYVEEHPGGMAIMYNAGGDATEGFHGPQHPPTVHELLKDYCIGTLAHA
ncbi:hypothetical protein OEZ86_001273 [Tetradesmus obliquus]|uniref:Cytochrome b5 heme-binding domain-containing protein n=1 Tax=Tetradesmus obliquus TaxID=3088 RepID=A0A383VH15_TETOB|nr:hypothetical protein OEZ86_001273 [Tetradesmus obliquus]|eukprot:jgi/Sobl393_1/17526/SZX63974.1